MVALSHVELIRKVCSALKEKRRGKLQRGMLFHQDKAPSRTLKHWLSLGMPDSNYSITHRTLQIGYQATSSCFQG